VNASSINGYTVAQFLAVPLISTVSTFNDLHVTNLTNWPGNPTFAFPNQLNIIAQGASGQVNIAATYDTNSRINIEGTYTSIIGDLTTYLQAPYITLNANSNITATAPSSINFYSSNLRWNDAPIGGSNPTVSTFTDLHTSILTNNPAISQTLTLNAYTAGVPGGFTQLVNGDPYFVSGQTVTIKNISASPLVYLYVADAIGNIYYNGYISTAPGGYFTFTLVAYPTGYLQTSANDSAGNSINQILQPSSGLIDYYVIGGAGVNPIQVGTLVVAVPATGIIEMATSTINLPEPTVIKGNQQTLLTNLFLAQTSNYFDFYSLNSNAEMYLDVAGNSYLAGISTVLMNTASQNILLDATRSNISITNSNGNIQFTTIGGVVDIYTSNLNYYFPSGQGGQLTIDSDAQLNYATRASSYGIGSNAPIPLIQCGTVRLAIAENNTLIGGAYSIPIPYDDGSYCLQLTYKTTPTYAPDAGIVWSGQAAASNLFEISAIGSNVGTGVTLDWYWTTIGKYPKGAAV
jgi:hypothetical protein